MLGEKIGVTQRTLTFAFSSLTGAGHPGSLFVSGVIVGGHLWLLGYLFSYLFLFDGGVGVEEKESWPCVICSLLFSTPSLSHSLALPAFSP